MQMCLKIFLFMVVVILPLSAKPKLPSPCYLLDLTAIGFPAVTKTPDAWPVHDLIFYNEKLFIGYGDAVVNTGPTDIIYYDTEKDTFITEFTVDEEAIYLYQVIDGQLMIPGIDATEDWTLGNFYVRGDSTWTKYRSIPHGIHVNSLASFQDRLFACTGAFSGVGSDTIAFGSIFSSADNGLTWSLSYTTPTDEQNTYRVNAIIPFQQVLYAFSFAYYALKKEAVPEKFHSGLSHRTVGEDYHLLLKPDIIGSCDAVVYDGSDWSCQDILPYENLSYIARPFVFNDQLMLPILCGEYIDYLNKNREKTLHAKALLIAYDGKKSREIKLQYDLLIDVLVKADTLFLLIERDSQHYITTTIDLKKWTYYLIPPSLTTPKSLEYSSGTFYIGAGDGIIFASRPNDKIKDIAMAQGVMPEYIIGALPSQEPATWYWLTLESRQTPEHLALAQAEIKHNNIIKVVTDNISAFSIELPWKHLNPKHEIMLIINNVLVFEGSLDGTSRLACTYDESRQEFGWTATPEP